MPDECITDVTPGSHVFSCNDLTFNMHVPASCLESACGLIFDVHGFTMSGEMEDANTELSTRALEYGFIVVQPNATPDPPQASWDPATDDDKVFDFLERTIAAWHIDEARVHFTGFSQGGFMTWRMLCAHPDVFASVAPAAYADGCDTPPGSEVDVLYMHGTSDNLVPFSTAPPYIDSLRTSWSLDSESVVSSDADYTWSRLEGSSGTVVEFIQHGYTANAIIGGHCYPGSTDDGSAPGQVFSFACEQPAPFHWGQAVLDFFIAHPRD